MNIDDLHNDIEEMEQDWENLEESVKDCVRGMNKIAELYEEGEHEECEKAIMAHRDRFGVKLNIL